MTVHEAVAEWAGAGRRLAVMVVLAARGSTPCKAGARAVRDAGGGMAGTIGGGQVEAEALRRAAGVIAGGGAEVFEFSLESGAVAGGEPICGGSMRVLVGAVTGRIADAHAAAAAAQRERRRGLLVTRVWHGEACRVEVQWVDGSGLVEPGGTGVGTGAEGVTWDELREALRGEAPSHRLIAAEGTAAWGSVEVFVEPLAPRPMLLVAGGGHVGQAVAWQADRAGFEVTVVDDRAEFTVPELYPAGVKTRCGEVAGELAARVTPETYVVLVTRGHRGDAEVLAVCLGRELAYLGMIGSRRKVGLMRQEFIATLRATAAEFDRVYAPIGLEIGAVTVPEIACSIVAQLIAVRRTGRAERMRGAPLAERVTGTQPAGLA